MSGDIKQVGSNRARDVRGHQAGRIKPSRRCPGSSARHRETRARGLGTSSRIYNEVVADRRDERQGVINEIGSLIPFCYLTKRRLSPGMGGRIPHHSCRQPGSNTSTQHVTVICRVLACRGRYALAWALRDTHGHYRPECAALASH